jgi:hypothetical protein
MKWTIAAIAVVILGLAAWMARAGGAAEFAMLGVAVVCVVFFAGLPFWISARRKLIPKVKHDRVIVVRRTDTPASENESAN